ncbi:hypothetical protein PIB30_031064 [Stylosanthes scabra]|uniref:Uncharacterized protein n=1 Tax=Stylosanthes scabra TaxID=79078 RepID=A0ABU6SBE0_9FABA|nr:hypothetical protein [Stylosanthes scabra]
MPIQTDRCSCFHPPLRSVSLPSFVHSSLDKVSVANVVIHGRNEKYGGANITFIFNNIANGGSEIRRSRVSSLDARSLVLWDDSKLETLLSKLLPLDISLSLSSNPVVVHNKDFKFAKCDPNRTSLHLREAKELPLGRKKSMST